MSSSSTSSSSSSSSSSDILPPTNLTLSDLIESNGSFTIVTNDREGISTEVRKAADNLVNVIVAVANETGDNETIDLEAFSQSQLEPIQAALDALSQAEENTYVQKAGRRLNKQLEKEYQKEVKKAKMRIETPDSPPESSARQERTSDGSNGGPSMSGNVDGHASPTGNGGSSGSSGGGQKNSFGAPGSSYSGKKYHEEYERALEGLLDKQWDGTKYGDPLAENQT